MRFTNLLLPCVLCAGLLSAEPASARRTVIDGGISVPVSGYCSPSEAVFPGCSATALPFSIVIGGQTYSSVNVNSNGTLSFVSIAPQLALQNSFDPSTGVYTGPAAADSLGDYQAPIFSPNFVDGPGYALGPPFSSLQGFDGAFASTQTVSGNSLTVNFFTCTTTIACGSATIDRITNAVYDGSSFGLTGFIISLYSPTPGILSQESFDAGQANLLSSLNNSLSIYTITLTDLGDGFSVDYLYSPAALGEIGTSGFHLPDGLNETSGPLANRSFVFGNDGQLLTAAVPEPATWLTMLLGFALAGASLQRRRTRAQLKAV